MNNKKEYYDIAIIGAGVIGSAIARELSKYKINAVLIEKENDVAEGISKANSGVIHAGFNVKPGTMKAKFNLEGLSMLPAIADELGLEYRICKKMVIAKNDDEKKELQKLFNQGIKNNTPGLSIINESEIKNIEPSVNGKWALLSEKTGIITPYLLLSKVKCNCLIKYNFYDE
jgi:glycerol-3-phosphate dehydrogenase